MNRLASLTAAVTNLRNASQYFTLANSLFHDLGAEVNNGKRPISLDTFTRDGKPTQFVFLNDGVRQIAEIAGTEVIHGVKNKYTDWDEFISTEYDGIVFYQIEKESKDEKTV